MGDCVLVGLQGRQWQLHVSFRGREVRHGAIAVHCLVSASPADERRLEAPCNVQSSGAKEFDQYRLVALTKVCAIAHDCNDALPIEEDDLVGFYAGWCQSQGQLKMTLVGRRPEV